MISLDYIIIFVILISCYFGCLRGLLCEIISIIFWFFNFYFFKNYYYFISFYNHAIKNFVLQTNISILMIFIFFLFLRRIIFFFGKTIIQKMHLYYLDMLLGGFLGILRGFLFIFFFLILLKLFNEKTYQDYVSHSKIMPFFYRIEDYL